MLKTLESARGNIATVMARLSDIKEAYSLAHDPLYKETSVAIRALQKDFQQAAQAAKQTTKWRYKIEEPRERYDIRRGDQVMHMLNGCRGSVLQVMGAKAAVAWVTPDQAVYGEIYPIVHLEKLGDR